MDDEDSLRISPRGIVAMLCSVGLHLAILGALAPVLPLYVTSLGATPAQWGIMVASAGCLMIFSEPAWGWLADRLGFRRPYLVARLGLAAGLWLLVVWPELLVILLWQVVSGLFETTIGVLGRGYLVRAYPPARQTFGLSLYLVVYSVCLALGSTTGGYLFQQAGPRAVFVLIAGLGSLASLAAFFVIDPSTEVPAAVVASAPPRQPQPILGKGMLILGVAGLLQFVGNRVVRGFLVLLARDQAHLDASAAGVLFGVFSVANIIFLALLNRFDRRLGLVARVAAGLGLGATAMVVYSLARSYDALLLAVTLDAFGWSLASPARIVLVGRLSTPATYGRALGLHGSFENVGVLLGPLLAGLLWNSVGPAAAYQVTAVLLAGGALLALGLYRTAPSQAVRRAEQREAI